MRERAAADVEAVVRRAGLVTKAVVRMLCIQYGQSKYGMRIGKSIKFWQELEFTVVVNREKVIKCSTAWMVTHFRVHCRYCWRTEFSGVT